MKRPLTFLFIAVTVVATHQAHALDSNEALAMVFDDPIGDRGHERAGKTIDRPALDAGKGCTLAIMHIDDFRRNHETVGGGLLRFDAPLSIDVLRSGDGVSWMRSAVNSLKRFGFAVQLLHHSEPASGVLPVDIRLKLAHAWSAGLTLNSHVTVEAAFLTSSGKTTRRYHGFGAKTNWWNGNGEYMETLNMAVAEILDSIVLDASVACRAGTKA